MAKETKVRTTMTSLVIENVIRVDEKSIMRRVDCM